MYTLNLIMGYLKKFKFSKKKCKWTFWTTHAEVVGIKDYTWWLISITLVSYNSVGGIFFIAILSLKIS